ncbi:ribosomal protein S4 [Stylosanthes scabra]|uniref:Ribosomal protein S4 n=1 Tax=Stylosanthes scabra TaxID=79078 RepID=A0ABU6UN63_9FABA|nr:ribosomal protein S4 [Stylosanthes scabra]
MHRGIERTSYIPFLLNPETRSDVIPVRLHFRETIPQARQPISHRRVCVNNRMVSITRLKVSHGDLISFQENDAKIRGWFAMIRKGMAPAKASTSTAASSVARNPSQPLNDTYFDTKFRNNAGKLVARNLICERSIRSRFRKRSKEHPADCTDTASED